jgi:von Willebrand factor type A domain
MKLSSALLVLPLLLSGVAGQDDGKAIRAYKKATRSTSKSPKTIEEREAALALLGDHDSRGVARVLVAAYDEAEGEAVALDELRMAHMAEYKELVAKLTTKAKKVRGSKEDIARYKQLSRLFIPERNEVDALRGLQFAVRRRLERLRRPESLEFALRAVIGKKKYSIGMQLTVARTAGACGVELLEALTGALSRAKSGPARLALLDGIGLLGEAAKPSAKVVLKLLENKDPEINERAALALSRMLIPEAIEPMINLMLRSGEGARKRRLAASLEVLTRKPFGTSASTWQSWWAQQKDKYLAGGMPLGGGTISANAKHNRENYYFGIPQEGKAIMYIIDASGSMRHPVKRHVKTGTTAAANESDAKTSRLEACKKELIRALSRLDAKTKFNIIWYSSLPHLFRKSMSAAAKPTVKSAQDWVRKLNHQGSTNIHDSMQMAFQKIGRGSRDKAYDVSIDTIFLLTDGTPTRPDGKRDSTEKIIKAVAEWNPLKRVTIHCIGIGDQLNVAFLSQLAAENGGQFKRY